jgi:FkbM family methyltransferase
MQHLKDRILETSSTARRIYGLKLILCRGPFDASRWFLFNGERLKYKVKFKQEGLVLDIGSYLGEYTEKIRKLNPQLTFWLYEPIPEYCKICVKRFKENERVVIHQAAVSADGRTLQMQIDGLRSREDSINFLNATQVNSINIQEIFDSVTEIELMKMNIEGMEYECLQQLIHTDSLIKAKHLLIQFHNFDVGAHQRREVVRKQIERDFVNIFTFDWIWELWIRKSE